MSLFKCYRGVLFAGVVALSAVFQIQAGSITIGSANSVNGLPFEIVTSGTYQQIYSGSDFGSSPVSLNGVTFFGQSGSTITSATYTVDVSTTTAGIGNSALYSPGANNTQEFTGNLSGPITGGSFTIPFAKIFSYNPATSNLLLQITISGGPANPGGLGLYTMSNGGALFSRAYNVFSGPTNVNFADSTGLVTQFDTPSGSPAAEPGSLLLLGTALVGGAVLMRRSRFGEMLAR